MYAETDMMSKTRPKPARSDRELLDRSRLRDESAFGQLVERHQDLLINYTTRMLGCRSLAEDVAQETFVRFYRHLDRYRDEGNLKAYLLRIATNLVRSRERRRRRWRLLLPAFMGESTDTAPASPQRHALGREAHRALTEAIRDLDLRFRAPLVMREVEGLSYRDISRALGLTEGTVKSRLHRARSLLKAALAPYLEGEPQ